MASQSDQDLSELRDLCRGVLARVAPGRAARSTLGTGALGAFVLINGMLSILLIGIAAVVFNEPLLFPSLGPTAFLLSMAPLASTTSPRNIIVGHLIGVVAGFISLVAFQLVGEPSAFAAGASVSRSGAAALSLGLTAAGMLWLDRVHAPAAATTLIVSLGLLAAPAQLAALMTAVVLLAYQGVAVNRFAGLHVPLWGPTT